MKTFRTLFLSSLLAAGASATDPGPAPDNGASPAKPAAPPSADLVLTGLIAFGAERWATLVHTDAAGARRLYTMKEGQATGTLRVVRIDQAQASVEVESAGRRWIVAFATPAVPAATGAVSEEEARRLRFVREHARFHEEQFRLHH